MRALQRAQRAPSVAARRTKKQRDLRHSGQALQACLAAEKGKSRPGRDWHKTLVASCNSSCNWTPLPPIFAEVLILEGLKPKITEVLILVDFKCLQMSEIQKSRKFLEVLILKGVRFDISPP